MYYYLYDAALGDKKYFNTVAQIETRLTDLGINGKINRLSFLKNIEQIISEELRRGLKTVVVVGNDKTFSQVINLIGDLNVVFGYVPVMGISRLAEQSGIPLGPPACDILSSRLIEKIDLGQINGLYFVSGITMEGAGIRLSCDNNYFINLENKKSRLIINNLGGAGFDGVLPNDGKLDVFIENEEKISVFKKQSVVSRINGKQISIDAERSLPIKIIDDGRVVKTPSEIKILPTKIKLIVGKKRNY